MKRSDCYMTFTQALEEYLEKRAECSHAPYGCHRWESASADMEIASAHMEALTGNGDPEDPSDE